MRRLALRHMSSPNINPTWMRMNFHFIAHTLFILWLWKQQRRGSVHMQTYKCRNVFQQIFAIEFHSSSCLVYPQTLTVFAFIRMEAGNEFATYWLLVQSNEKKTEYGHTYRVQIHIAAEWVHVQDNAIIHQIDCKPNARKAKGNQT